MSVQQLRRFHAPRPLQGATMLIGRCLTAISCISGWIVVVLAVFGVAVTALAASTGVAALLLATFLAPD
ncbi:MAG TPA: hypothetical protein VNJ54_04600 [Plantibacter sp.]|uniref:hypothetical protein n=1 Tax=unclassified Plantibacter TaxID=2624265 RepID=UPI002B949E34|nr:hypothetical protein [Plantibacter sp.]